MSPKVKKTRRSRVTRPRLTQLEEGVGNRDLLDIKLQALERQMLRTPQSAGDGAGGGEE